MKSKVSPGHSSPGGRSFHSRGLAAEKLLSLSLLCVLGTSSFRLTTMTLFQPFTMKPFAKRTFQCSAPVVWNSLPKAVLNSDFVAVFKSRLKMLLFSQAFSSSSAHLTRCLALAPLKLQPHDATQICLLLLLLLLLVALVQPNKMLLCLQCSDTVGWASGRAPGL